MTRGDSHHQVNIADLEFTDAMSKSDVFDRPLLFGFVDIFLLSLYGFATVVLILYRNNLLSVGNTTD